MDAKPRRCDIFCTVIDNFGDIGICWRLACQLADEQAWPVRLYVDRMEALRAIAPGFSSHRGIAVSPWPVTLPVGPPPQVVIEAFGCHLPPAYVAQLARQRREAIVVNLEYLTAEPWAGQWHGLPSPGVAGGLAKRFFFPGFDTQSGGLLRESDYAARAREFDEAEFRKRWRLGPRPPRVISMFAYPHAPLAALIDALAADVTPTELLLPGATMAAHTRGTLRLQPLPFLPQATYDELLWASDLNFVRGEDSFVRAQWAARPFVWQAYRQPDDAHLAKLAAFLDRFAVGTPNFSGGEAAVVRRFWTAWNGAGDLDWPAFCSMQGALSAHCRHWSRALQAQPTLCQRLVSFCNAIVE